MTEKISRLAKTNVEKTLSVTECFSNNLWNMWQMSMGNMTWANERMEQMVGQCLEKRRNAIEEGVKLADQVAKQVKTDQDNMRKMFTETLKGTFEYPENPVINYFSGLNKKMMELSPKQDSSVA